MTHPSAPAAGTPQKDPWPALFALCIGFFMIMIDMTIVTVATPVMIDKLDASTNEVIWVTSAYTLAYAVPLLITGRLGDRYGMKLLFQIGLVVFTLASLWCGLSTSIGMLIVARVVQGLGAAMINPQTMAIITRIFPAQRRGQAMAVWGATAGVAMLVGPLLGGLLVDTLGWEWIFFINIPVGVLGLVMAQRLVPALPTHAHRFDWLGVVLSGVAIFLLVFGIQQAHQWSWDGRIWLMLVCGLVLFGAFLVSQARNRQEPLVPLSLFRDRNFSVASIGISVMGFMVVAMSFPFMLYAQLVRGDSPIEAALLMVPMALFSIVMARPVGFLTDRVHPRNLTTVGFAIVMVSLLVLADSLRVDSGVWEILLAMSLLGLGSSMLWSPLAATANRNLAPALAGAGSGVYNATRQFFAVIGSAAIAMLMDARLAAQGLGEVGVSEGSSGRLPEAIRAPFADAMAQSMLLPAAVLVVGFVASFLFVNVHAEPRASVSTTVGGP